MYGVPKDLDLSGFVGKILTQIAIGEFQVQFNFHPDGHISAMGDWELRDHDGSLIDRALPNKERSEYRLHLLLGQEVACWEIDPPRLLSLGFASGHVLRVFDDSQQYESFMIQPGDIVV